MASEQQPARGTVVHPEERLSQGQVELIDEVSREILADPGLYCYNHQAAGIFEQAGIPLEPGEDSVRVRIPSGMIDRALESAPSKIVLGARDPANRLVLDAHEPRVCFGSGSETNFWLQVDFDGDRPSFQRLPGSIEKLTASAHLCDNLDNLDFFIRNVNIQDPEVTDANKDVNMFLASLNNITKHVQAGLTSLDALDDVIRLGQLVAGGEKAFEEAPVLSFITCAVKSPLQLVDDTTDKLIEISRRRVPVVISSCPMAGATGPFDEFGMVAQINAELLAGIVLNQLASPGAPILYGAVPVRTRLDNLNDMYGAPEFNHYNMDCAQMARYYGIPCYSTAGVGDTSLPGIQATAEKLLTLLSVPRAGAQYIHYAFGLLERTNVFCPEQAVMDDAHIGVVRHNLRESGVSREKRDEVVGLIREVMGTSHRSYVYHLPLPSREEVYVRYPLEHDEGGALRAAHEQYLEIMKRPHRHLPAETREAVRRHVPNVLPASMA